ncbi:MAG TPA: MaoC family dehydratase N-terminal domain-containing protein, partial [Solirubrobacteraceae bacterium]|nr:MaoC family dehydratase N-terminal domain-containing protein [Solirubrobacteraceae bacterium]
MTTTEFASITEDALQELRDKIGEPVRRGRPFVTECSADAIRHYALGIGDRNPLWRTPNHDGHVLAPPSILFAMDKILSGYVTGLPGIHAMFAGADLRFERPLHEGDRLTGTARLKALIERPSAFAGRSIQQIYEVQFHDPHGALVATGDSYCFRTERDTARDRGKYEQQEFTWTRDQ